MNAGTPNCDLCAGALEASHGHVVDTAQRRLLCACYACTLLFAAPGAARGRFKVVPKRYCAVSAPLFSDAQWEALGIPIGLAFFFRNSANDRVVAFYPGPAGATESLLPMEHWDELCIREPLIAGMLPDIEAVLVYRQREAAAQAYVVPIDVCYELAGLIRSTWRGVNGGEQAQQAVAAFFVRIAAEAAQARESVL